MAFQKLNITFVLEHYDKDKNVLADSSGLPLYYRTVPGNVVDVSTLERVFLHQDSMCISIEFCIMAAGYNTSVNFDLFYDKNHTCKIGFITRLRFNDKEFRTMFHEELPAID